MKIKTMISVTLLLCITAMAPIVAQGYPVPSRELVASLLEQLDECKKELVQAEKEISIMEKAPGNYSLETYLLTKKYIKELKSCIKSSRSQLDTLREGYSGWFNSPNAFSDIRMTWPKIDSPQEIAEELERLERVMLEVVERFEKIQKPKE